jgi:hypothetical protein
LGENNHDPRKNFIEEKLFFLFSLKFYTSARVDSTTVCATSLGSYSSSHVGLVRFTGGIGLGTSIFKEKLG